MRKETKDTLYIMILIIYPSINISIAGWNDRE